MYEITAIQKLLMYGLTLFPIKEDTQISILAALETDTQRAAMIDFLTKNEKATEQEILNHLGWILEETEN